MGVRAGLDTGAGGKILYLRRGSNPDPVCSQTLYCVRFQVFTAVTMKFRVFWDYDGGSTHLRNVGLHLLDYTAVHPRRLET
jgi:hypothetical protein